MQEPLYDSSLFLDENSLNKVEEFTRDRRISTEKESNHISLENINERK